MAVTKLTRPFASCFLASPSRGERGELALTLRLRHGGSAEISLPYELTGSAGASLLVVAGGISAGRHVVASDAFPEAGWWQSQAGTLNVDRYRVLAIDWVGADGAIDAPIDPADQADAIAQLLASLGIDRIAGFIGASYGAMVGMHLAARMRENMGALLAISASHSPHPFASACRALQRQALALGALQGESAAGVALARAMAILTYRTPDEFEERFAADPKLEHGRVRVAAEDYLDFQGARHCQRMTSTAYLRLSESIDLHRIEPSVLSVPLTLVAVDSDALVPAKDIETVAKQVPGAAFHLIHSRFGHDAFLKEERQVGTIIAKFLESVEQRA